ncbi:MAG TPA: L,D-transpeptidase family protein [Syntrophales bacterium]
MSSPLRTLAPVTSAMWPRLTVIVILGLFLYGCAAPPKMSIFRSGEEQPEKEIERHAFAVEKKDNVIGRLAAVRVRDGDTLPDIARHFGLGLDEVIAANPEMDVWAPRAGSRVLLPLMFILPDSPRQGIVINLAAMRLFYYGAKSQSSVLATYPVGIGDEGRSTPVGAMLVERKAVKPTWYVPASIRKDHQQKGDPLPPEVPPGPDNPLGEYALYLSRASYVIHGTNKPYSIGLRATNGCIRLYPEDIRKLYQVAPVKTKVHIVNQPYLIGRANGTLYLEIHAPQEEMNAGEVRKRLYARLTEIEKREKLQLDWNRVDETVRQARGIPVPILRGGESMESIIANAAEIEAPAELRGQPRIPAMKSGAWYVRADESPREINARRLAAVLNHQGPQIPARVIQKGNLYQVVAGPYASQKAAAADARRLRSDLEIEGVLIAPSGTRDLALQVTGNR